MREATPWIRGFPASVSPGTPWTVLFFPHSGGSAGSYRDLAAQLAGTARTACVEYPGRAERVREPLFTDVHVLADQAADAVAGARGDGPMIFFGHSLGAVVAYEVVRRMPDQRQLVLVASGHPAPSRLTLSGLLDDAGSAAPDERLAALVRSLGGADAELLEHPLLRQVFLPVIRSDLVAHSRYRPDPDSVVGCPVIALMGAADPLTTAPDVQAWERHTTSGLRVHVFPGGHFFTNRHPREVADVLRRVMTTDRNAPAR
ncbi:alpha/beta fold hydrolase [Micromonospora sp. WMMD956]|jgi:surfactin synthase thioesterase subunit|uniref:thioesterase II family protein n=2 Tax=Micromonosporaceae TaxID=28056 RepID=UPI00241681E5|nr:alpha/beta fold hydrolase [Micromonospora sp. WMMD956]MDG4818817.1 alpha/beta fold hydrolase [Micromonospora sp. WMMD956]